MKKTLLLLIIILASIKSFSQIAGITYSFTNEGIPSQKNIWGNYFNWKVWDGTAWILPSNAPGSSNDVIINLDNLVGVGAPTVGGVSTVDRLLIDATSSCRSFSITGVSTNKGVKLAGGVTLNIYGHFDLSGAPKCAIEAALFYSAAINFIGSGATLFDINTNDNTIQLPGVTVTGNYQLLNDYSQFVNYNSPGVSGGGITISGKLKTNAHRINTTSISNVSSAANDFDITGSIINISRLGSYKNVLTNGTEEIYFSDTLNNSTAVAYITINYGSHLDLRSSNLNVKKIKIHYTTIPFFQTYTEGTTTITSQLVELDLSANFSKINTDTFRVTNEANITIENNNSFKTIETPGVCTKLVSFKSSDNISVIPLTVLSAVTVSSTSWLSINVIGAGSIVANNSIDLGNNSGNLTINSPASRILAWCGSVDSDWGNSANWRLLSGGGCGVCPPTLKDSVVFDPIYLSGANTQTVDIKSSAYCDGISFLYPTSNPIVIKGIGTWHNAGGLWIGYPSGMVANTSLKGTDWSAFTGKIYMNTAKKMVTIATQNVPIDGAFITYQESLTFMGGGSWYFKDDFTAPSCIFSIVNGHVKCGSRTITVMSAYLYNQLSKIVKLDLDTCLLTITGTSGKFYTSATNKLFVYGGRSTVLFTSTYPGGNLGGGDPSVDIRGNTLDTLLNRSVYFWNVKFMPTMASGSLLRYSGDNSVLIHKLTLPPLFYSRSLAMWPIPSGYPYLEVDSLNIADCNKYTMSNHMTYYNLPNVSAIKINQAIVTSTLCGVYNNLFSDHATIPADIIVPTDFGTSKVFLSNVTVNNGTGTLTAINSIPQGITTGWVIPPATGQNFYWNGEGITTNWDEPRNWNVTVLPSSGTTDDVLNNPSNCIPGPLDSVFFVDNSFPLVANTPSVTLKGACYAKTIKWTITSGYIPSSIIWNNIAGANLHIYESLLMNDRPNLKYTTETYFWGTSNLNQIQSSDPSSSNRKFLGGLNFEGTGSYKLLDNLSALRILVNHGTFNANKYTVTSNCFKSAHDADTINIKKSNLFLGGGCWFYGETGGSWSFNSNKSILKADSSSIYIDGIGGAYGGGLDGSACITTGTNIVTYNKVVFYGGGGGCIKSLSDNLFSFNKVDFQGVSTRITGSNRIDTLLYDPMSTNELEAGKIQSVDSLRAISNLCQNLIIKSTSAGTYADICDIGTFKKLTTTFGDIIDIRSNTCAGFTVNNETYNGGVTNSLGWIVSPNSLHFGFPVPSFTTACDNGPVALNTAGFYASASSTYSWSTGATTSAITVKNPGTYSVIVNYKPLCSTIDSVKVNFYPLQAIHSETAAICNAEANGLAYFSLTTDSTSSHTYQYTLQSSIPSTSVTYSNSPSINYNGLAAGVYTLTLVDTTTSLSACRYTQTLTISEPNALLTNASVSSSVSCFGNSTGALTSNPTGGNGGYLYSWTDGITTYTTQNVNTIPSNVYTLTVTDSKTCTTTTTLNVTQPSTAITSTIGATSDVLCFGGATGAATVNASGGTGAITYTWLPSGGNNSIATGLTFNTYTINMLDANNCPTSQTLSINQPTAALNISSSSSNSLACFGANTGSLSITITGGTTTYTTAWTGPSSYTNTSSGTTSTLTSLNQGSYNALVTDANGCTTNTTIVMAQPSASLTLSSSSASVACFGANTGSLSISVSGGTAPYTYTWNPGAINTQTLNNISAGDYTVTLLDANLCPLTQSFSISQPTAALSVGSVNTQSIACFGNATGSATIIANGGTPNYVYTSNSGTSNNAIVNNLSNGTYTYYVTDANGCATTTNSFAIAQPTSAITATGTQTNVLCNGQSNGIADVTATGGTSPYTYTWTVGTSTTQTNNNLSVGNYTATVTDANACITTQTFTIIEPNVLTTIITTTTQANCGMNNGSATYTATGGTTAYTYSWTPPSPALSYTTTSTSTNSLSAGFNQLTVIDANGCTTNTSVNITNPNAPVVTTTVSNINCFGTSTGSITTAINGTSSYSYLWSNGAQTAELANIAAGVYTLTVTDNNACVSVQTATITQPTSAVSILINNMNPVSCFGASTGSVSALATGGTPSYTYTWNPGTSNNPSLNNIPAGNYTVNVTDNNGCVTSSVVIINSASSSALNVVVDNSEQATCDQSNGSITTIVTGGTPNYIYNWNTGTSTNQTLSNIAAGTYTLIVTDNYNCKDTITITMDCKIDLFIPQLFSPNGDGKNDKFDIKGITNYPNNIIQIFNRWGSLVYSKNKYNNDWDGKANVGDALGKATLPAGTYFVVLEFGDGETKPYHNYVQLEY